MSELLPCPFCDCAPELGHSFVLHPENGCVLAGCEFGDWGAPQNRTISAWNTRSNSFPELVAALEEVLRFRRGEGKYRFVNLPDSERECAMFDAWQEVEAQVVSALKVGRG